MEGKDGGTPRSDPPTVKKQNKKSDGNPDLAHENPPKKKSEDPHVPHPVEIC